MSCLDSPTILRVVPGDGLLVVDMQEDFMEGGALPVHGARTLVEPLNRVIRLFEKRRLPVIFSRDWHPKGHCSFIESGGMWPSHCVQESEGAKFSRGLYVPGNSHVVSKGTKLHEDAYSAFKGTELQELVRNLGIKRFFVGGVATDFCVKDTVLDALKLGLEVFLLRDCTAWVQEETGRKALKEMERFGASFIEHGSLG